MKLEHAKVLLAALSAAVADAEQAGSDEVQLQSALQAADDQARAELQAAIDAARG